MIPNGYKPLLAIDFNKVKSQPVNRSVSIKLDGIRCCIFGGVAYSRTLKPIPNKSIQQFFMDNKDIYEGFDGELIVGDMTAPDVFNKSTSAVMRIEGTPDFTFYVFDIYQEGKTFIERYHHLVDLIENPFRSHVDKVSLVGHLPVFNQEGIDNYESICLARGAEGIMIRDNDAMYKCGRSATKMPELQKVKRFVDAEFEIVGFEPKYENHNEATVNELGRTARSTSKDGLVAVDLLGALVLKTASGDTFNCGSGFNDEMRQSMWRERNSLIGKLAKVKYFDVGSGYCVPRFPVFIGIRDKNDM